MNSEIQDMLKKADLLLRPYALFINPKDKELFNEVEDKVKIYPTELIEPGKMYLIDRKELEMESYIKALVV